MSNHIYRSLLKVLEKWPLDASKKGRDLGEVIRTRIASSFPQGEASKVHDLQRWTSDCNVLDRIASDHYKLKYPLHTNPSATGLEAKQCRDIVSTSFLQDLNNGN